MCIDSRSSPPTLPRGKFQFTIILPVDCGTKAENDGTRQVTWKKKEKKQYH